MADISDELLAQMLRHAEEKGRMHNMQQPVYHQRQTNFGFLFLVIILAVGGYWVATHIALDTMRPVTEAAPVVRVAPQPRAPIVSAPQVNTDAVVVVPLPRPTAIVVPSPMPPTVAPAIPLAQGEYTFTDRGPSAFARYCVQMPDRGVEICDHDISMTFPDTQTFIARSIKLGTMIGTPIAGK